MISIIKKWNMLISVYLLCCLLVLLTGVSRGILGFFLVPMFLVATVYACRLFLSLLFEKNTNAEAARRGVYAIGAGMCAASLALPVGILRPGAYSIQTLVVWALCWMICSIGFSFSGTGGRKNSSAYVVVYALAHVPVFGLLVRRTDF